MATTLAAPARAALGYDGALTCAINVSDLDAGIAWYRDTLGMELLYRVDEIAWCEFESPVARVSVGLAQVERVVQGGGATLTFGVVDLDAAKAVLDAAGVRQDGPVQEIPGMVRLLTFYDPDGNALMFAQDLAGQG
ncbi:MULTISPECIES: VOC family protein [unclassified Sphingomonas]|jgi:catechol 2,3-dioxygenase-like lactoylglutathione lyase family enzyme|uniref:VOC family protein n=1 Tax=unclassified Sphingomonas TaxID=196159 RepID=UPI000A644D7C|nr:MULTISPECIES: VOC family protein [unclassified Sphingomonas]